MITFAHLEGVEEHLAEGLSWAQQKRLMLATALADDPRLILLDDPFAGMNSDEIAEMITLIRAIRKKGMIVFVIDHNVKVMQQICDRMIVLNFGRKLAEGDPERIARDPRVIEAYLGYDEDASLEQDRCLLREVTGPVRSRHVGRSGRDRCPDRCQRRGEDDPPKAISGLIPWQGGDIPFNNHSLRGMKTAQIAMQGISHVPERGGIIGKMTVLENSELRAAANPTGKDREGRFKRVFDLFPVLKARSSQLGSLLSGGERQMLAIGRAMMSSPQLYLLDEPTLGLSPVMGKQIGITIPEISNPGGTILLVEQNARMALKISQRGYVLEIGRILSEGPTSELLEDEEVKKSYLGA